MTGHSSLPLRGGTDQAKVVRAGLLELAFPVAFTQFGSVCSTTSRLRATEATLWPDSTSRTASCLNSSVYLPRFPLPHLQIPFRYYSSSLWDTFCAGKVTSAAHEVLKRRMTGLEGPYLFPCDADSERPIPKINNAHDRAVKESGIAPLRLYDLRHTWATRAAMSGIDLVTLAAMLGHSRIQMVLRYAHPTQAHQAKAMEQLEQFNAAQQIAAFEKQQPAMTQ